MAKVVANRSFGLSVEDVKSLREEGKGKFVNPHRSGAYRFSIDALIKLGANKFHPLARFVEAFKATAGADWFKAFKGKEARNDETGKDADERIIQNLKVLQRTNDYGLKLLEVGTKVMKSKGCVIDLQREGDTLSVRLNTNSAEPLKAGRAAGSDQKPSGGSKGEGKAAKGSKRANGVLMGGKAAPKRQTVQASK